MVLNVQLGDVGLVLDLAGGIFLFFFGLAPLLSRDGSMSLSTGNSDYLRRKARKYEILARLGVFLIVAGFVFQLLGNHVKWSTSINATTLGLALLFPTLGIVTVALVIRYKKRKYDLTAQYIPQFDKSKPSHMSEQLWHFVITNNSNRLLKSATLYFDVKPSIVTKLTIGEEPHTVTPSKKIQLEDIQPNKPITIQAWNIGGHITAGLDCYLEVNGKIVRPKVHFFESE